MSIYTHRKDVDSKEMSLELQVKIDDFSGNLSFFDIFRVYLIHKVKISVYPSKTGNISPTKLAK